MRDGHEGCRTHYIRFETDFLTRLLHETEPSKMQVIELHLFDSIDINSYSLAFTFGFMKGVETEKQATNDELFTIISERDIYFSMCTHQQTPRQKHQK